MLGMHGTYEANWAMHDCDFMLCVGARFDDRITGRTDAFSPGSFKVHVDIDASSINKNIRVHVADRRRRRLGRSPTCSRSGRSAARKTRSEAVAKWWKQIELWRARNCLAFRNSDKVIKPQHALQRLEALTRGRDRYITTEVGQHQMWAAQYLTLRRAQPLDDLAAASAPWATAFPPRSASSSPTPTPSSSTSPARPRG